MALWACRRLIAFVVALKSWLRDEQISPSEMGRRMDMRRIRSINAAACPPLHAVHAISKIVHNNLPEDDDETEGDESAINAAIFKESTELVHVHMQSTKWAPCHRDTLPSNMHTLTPALAFLHTASARRTDPRASGNCRNL